MKNKIDMSKLAQTLGDGSMYDALGWSALDYTKEEKYFILAAVREKLNRNHIHIPIS